MNYRMSSWSGDRAIFASDAGPICSGLTKHLLGSDPVPCKTVSSRQYSGSDPFAWTLHDDRTGYQQMGQTRRSAETIQPCRGKGQTRYTRETLRTEQFNP
jgi:hypothetical protein